MIHSFSRNAFQNLLLWHFTTIYYILFTCVYIYLLGKELLEYKNHIFFTSVISKSQYNAWHKDYNQLMSVEGFFFSCISSLWPEIPYMLLNRSCSQNICQMHNHLDALLRGIYEKGLGNRNLKIKKKNRPPFKLWIFLKVIRKIQFWTTF